MKLSLAVSALALVAPSLANPLPDLTIRAAAPLPSSNTGKRGLAYNDPTYTQPFSLSGQNSVVSWGYNWGQTPYTGTTQTRSNTFNAALRFIPMLWSNATVLTANWTTNVQAAINNYRTDAVLAFNEPDQCASGSACMSVNSSVAAWNSYIQPLAGKVTLVSPAVTNGATPAGLAWLSNFISACTNCRIDAIALHWYGASGTDGATAFQNYISAAYKQFNKPIWITEFGTEGATTDAQVTSFLKVVLPWIAQQSYISRVAYFMDANGFPYLINNGVLSVEGKMYNNNTGI